MLPLLVAAPQVPCPTPAKALKLTSAPNPRKAALPNELVHRILSDSSLTKKDIVQVRRASRWAKSVVDQAALPQFRLPNTQVGPLRTSRRTSVVDYLRAKSQAHTRAVTGQWSCTRLRVGQRSLVLTQRPAELMLRCGNGRLLLANLYDRSSLFTEVAPAGSLVATDTLLAAVPTRYFGESWRLLLLCQNSHARYICRVRQGERLLRQFLPTAPHMFGVFTEHERPLIFSADGNYLVEGTQHVTRRYLLGDGSTPIACLATLHGEQPATLCALTGRRFTYQGSVASSVAIYADAWSMEVTKVVKVDKLLGEVYGVSVSPDGNTFALLQQCAVSVFDGGEGLCFAQSSYDLPRCEENYVTCKYVQKKRPGFNLSGERHHGDLCWQKCPIKGWRLLRPDFIKNRTFDHDSIKRFGIEDDEKFVALCLSGWTTDLLLLSKLAPLGREALELSPPSFGQKLRFSIKQRVVWFDLSEFERYVFWLASLCLFVSFCLFGRDESPYEWIFFITGFTLIGFGLVVPIGLVGAEVYFDRQVKRRHLDAKVKITALETISLPLTSHCP